MATTTLTTSDIRVELGDIDDAELSDAVIEAALDYAETYVNTRIDDPDALDPGLFDLLVGAKAAHKAFTSSPAEKQRRALDLSTTWNIEQYVAALEARVEEAFDLVGDTVGGTSAAFAESTSGVFDAQGLGEPRPREESRWTD